MKNINNRHFTLGAVWLVATALPTFSQVVTTETHPGPISVTYSLDCLQGDVVGSFLQSPLEKISWGGTSARSVPSPAPTFGSWLTTWNPGLYGNGIVTIPSSLEALAKLTVEAYIGPVDSPGPLSGDSYPYYVNTTLWLANGRKSYAMEQGLVKPNWGNPDNPTPLDVPLSEKPGLLEFGVWCQNTSSYMQVNNARVVATLIANCPPVSDIPAGDPGSCGTVQATIGSLAAGSHDFHETLLVRGNRNYSLDVYYTTGSDAYEDLVTWLYHVDDTGTVPECGKLTHTDTYPTCAQQGIPIPGCFFGSITGQVQMLTEPAWFLSAHDRTLMKAFNGPLGNFRYAHVPYKNGSQPSEGGFKMDNNVVPSVAWPGYWPSTPYTNQAFMNFGKNWNFEYFTTPEYWPVTVDFCQTTDLQTTFVMDPGHVRGAIKLVGPPDSGGICPPTALKALVRYDKFDGDGIPYGSSNPEVNFNNDYDLGQSSAVEATGGTSTSSSSGRGRARVLFDGAVTLDGNETRFEGNYDLRLAGLNSEPSKWRPNTLDLHFKDTSSADREHHLQEQVVITDNSPEQLIPVGGNLTKDLCYCFGEVLIRVVNASSTLPFDEVAISGSGQGPIPSPDLPCPSAPGYSVSLSAKGEMHKTDPKTGLIRLFLPEGDYRLQTTVHYQTGWANQPEFRLKVKCRQCSEYQPGGPTIQINDCLMDTVTGSVTGPESIASISCSVDGNPCPPCPGSANLGLNPTFCFQWPNGTQPAAGPHTITVTAKDVVGVSTTTQFLINLPSSAGSYWDGAQRAGGKGKDSGDAIATDPAGNVYVAGGFEGTAQFGPFTLTSAGLDDIFIAKLDPSGAFLWATNAGGAGSEALDAANDRGLDLALDAANNVYVVGACTGPAQFGATTLASGGFIAKLDSNGHFLWATNKHSYVDAVTVHPSGGVYVASRLYWQGVYISCINPNNGQDCAMPLPTHVTDPAFASKITTDPAGNVYITGAFGNGAAFGSYSPSPSSYGKQDMFVAKLDSSLNWIWVQNGGTTNNDKGYSLVVDPAGNSYVVGNFNWGDFNTPATFGSYHPVSVGYQNIFVTKLDPAGNFLWASAAGGTYYDHGWGITRNSQGDLYITGNFGSSTANFGPDLTLQSSGSADVYVAKINPADGTFVWATRAGGPNIDIGYGIAADQAGCVCTGNCVYVTGFFETEAKFPQSTDGFGLTPLTSEGLTDAFVAKVCSCGSKAVSPVKFVQWPDISTNGLDVKATEPKILADDFLCTTTGAITNIQIWGSWLGDIPVANARFMLGIWSDVPASGGRHSQPGLLLWSNWFGLGDYSFAFYTNANEKFYDPNISGTNGLIGSDTNIWWYNFNPTNPFCQTGTSNKPAVYWLSVTAELGPAVGYFGWKTSTNHWNDDAVYGHVNAGVPLRDWQELRDPRSSNSLDLSFLLNDGPCTNCVVITCSNLWFCSPTNKWLTDYPVTAVDCQGLSLPVICTPPPPYSFAPGVTTVQCTAGGASCSFTVTVVEGQPQPLALYNTGVDNNYALLPGGAADPHYVLGVNPDGGTGFVVVDTNAYVLQAWLANNTISQWIGPRRDGNGYAGSTAYVYQVEFLLPCTNDVVITGRWAVDNAGEILLNGTPISDPGGTIADNSTANFNTWHPFTITSGFVPGLNVLDFSVTNSSAYTGLRVELSGSACCCTNETFYGAKFNDLNGDGIWQRSEPKLTNWLVYAYDQSTNLVASTATDANGQYHFDLPCGTYTLMEGQVAGWRQTAPTNGTYVVTVGISPHTGLNFGNTITTNCCDNCFPPYPASYTMVVPGNYNFNFLANVLCRSNTTLNVLLPNAPVASSVYKWNLLTQDFDSEATYFGAGVGWVPNLSLALGEGFALSNAGNPYTNTFFGCEPTCPLPCGPTNGCQLVGAPGLGIANWYDLYTCPPVCGTTLGIWNVASQNWETYTYLNSGWSPTTPYWGVGLSVMVCVQPNTNCLPCTNSLSVVCASNKTVECGSNWVFGPITATNACCGTNITIAVQSTVTNIGPCLSTYTRIWRVTDCSTNSATCTQTVTVVDIAPLVITSQPTNVTVADCSSATFAVAATGCPPLSYAWYRNGVLLAGAHGPAYTKSPVSLSDNGAQYRVVVSSPCRSVTSSVAILTVVADITPPSVLAAAPDCESNKVCITFSEPLDPASATDIANYSINYGVSVLSALLGPPNTVCLFTTPLTFGITYTITINGVRDLCGNVIAVNTQIRFSCPTNGSLSGQKFNDLNGNGLWDAGEPALAGWTIHLSNGQTATTDTSGYYYFMNLVPGTYTVSEVQQSGWVQTAPAGGFYSVVLGQAQATNGLNFGNYTNCCVPPWNPTNCCTNCAAPYLITNSVTVLPGYNYLVNPLCHGTNNTVGVLLPSVPDGTSLNKWNVALQGYGAGIQFYSGVGWLDDEANDASGTRLEPGEGFLLFNPSAAYTLTFVGCAPDLACKPCSPTNVWWLRGQLDAGQGEANWWNLFRCPPKCGTELRIWNGMTGYVTYTYLTSWNPSTPSWPAGTSVFVSVQPNTNCLPCTNSLSVVCASNKTVACGSNWVFDPITATNACCGTNITIAVQSTVTNIGPCLSTYTRIWRVTDCSTNSATCTQTVTVVDTTPPVLTNCNDIVTNATAGLDGAVVTYHVTATDSCQTNVLLVCTPPSGSFFPCGTNAVFCTATDACGNSNRCSFNVVVLCQCVGLGNEQLICDSNAPGQLSYSFDLQNNTGLPLNYILLVPDTNCFTFTPDIVTFHPALPPGQTANVSVMINLAGPCASNLCFTLLAQGSNQCCFITHCVVRPAGPRLLSAVPNCGGNKITVTFSEPLDPATWLGPPNFIVDDLTHGVSLAFASTTFGPDLKTVWLYTVGTLNAGTQYQLTVNNVRDTCGSVIAPNSRVTFCCPYADHRLIWTFVNGQLCLSWFCDGVLEFTTSLTPPIIWVPAPNQANPQCFAPGGGQRFYRLRL